MEKDSFTISLSDLFHSPVGNNYKKKDFDTDECDICKGHGSHLVFMYRECIAMRGIVKVEFKVFNYCESCFQKEYIK